MKIRILQQLVGPGVGFDCGEILERPDDEAKRLISAGIAEAVLEPTRDERATVGDAPRKATKR